jgi:hypothetical protein
MQIHPVVCPAFTRPTGVPERIVLDDSGVAACSLTFQVGLVAVRRGEGSCSLHIPPRQLGPAVDKGGTKDSGSVSTFRVCLQSFGPG